MISFEFPVTERTRILLRLEHLYARLGYFIGKDHPYDHHAALLVLFELMETASRADLKADLLQELERQKQMLEALRENPQVAEETLEGVLEDIEHASSRLLALTGKFGQHLRENEWLMAIKQRAGIPGGTCQFDLPSYHQWQQKSAEVRRQDIKRWASPLMPTAEAAGILLTLLRDSGKTHHYVARRGVFQQMSGGKVVQLIRVAYDGGLELLPELSANKYALNIRFVSAVTGESRPRQTEQDVEFHLTNCKF
ncbi:MULTISPECIES: cell division protein ZapD [Chromobacterium]|uniref:Cell division protein ZapD n=3 Tax=Chromobacterium TaxID=535 RepID=A0A1W0CYS9_9NEIS|nr:MULTISPECIES: cell division protein ZapD [Chromobacterium]MCP1289103.1 cell division protein ZapD [Chromobacterium sp. S0633]AXT48131.1 cell division protein ZapD [Chromobacterium rhizoryzae]MBK0414888.1 cell division protein ZapD [Chromobacterium haemolyticum]MBO0416442.1 cell division protein ZapD [Chromobacterium haemolyticum]MBO0499527.1 cell division protein ZapD [Chromobacterium haemolyticum]